MLTILNSYSFDNELRIAITSQVQMEFTLVLLGLQPLQKSKYKLFHLITKW